MLRENKIDMLGLDTLDTRTQTSLNDFTQANLQEECLLDW